MPRSLFLVCITSNILAYAPWSVLYSWVSFWKSNLDIIKAEFCKQEIWATTGSYLDIWTQSSGEFKLEFLERLNSCSFLWKTSFLSTCLASGLKGTADCNSVTVSGEKAEPTVSARSLTEPLRVKQLPVFYPEIICWLKPALWRKKQIKASSSFSGIVGCCPGAEEAMGEGGEEERCSADEQ